MDQMGKVTSALEAYPGMVPGEGPFLNYYLGVVMPLSVIYVGLHY